MTMARDSDDENVDEARAAASILQSKQLISTNVVTKRKEQLSRWEKSEMNNEPPYRTKRARVQFMDDDIFLSACMFGDEDEVEELLAKGADINTGTVDGLTALHQSVIDSKPEMVQFLCDKGANVNSQDNEGWTPLHAAACCGNVSIVQMLVEAGADLRAINCDKELAVDLAENDECRDFLENEFSARGIDLEDAREAELSTLMTDVKEWTRSGLINDKPHPKTGATALHVAAAKGYVKVVEMLIRAGADVNAVDYDGWTPLHAAAHWGEKNSQDCCKLLLNGGASVDALTLSGQSVIGVAADKDMVEFLEFEKADREAAEKEKSKKEASVLSEKNGRSSSSSIAAAAAVSVQSVTPSASVTSMREGREGVSHSHLSSEQKHALTVADERSENETLHPSKMPRLTSLTTNSEEERPSIPSRTAPTAAATAASEEEESGSKSNTYVGRPLASIGRLSSERESSVSSSITPSERSSSTSSTRNEIAAPSIESAAPASIPTTPTSAPPSSTVQFNVPLRSWTRPAPLNSSSARSSSTSTSSSSLLPTPTTPSSVSTPTMTSSPLTVKPPSSPSPSSSRLSTPLSTPLHPHPPLRSPALPWQTALTSSLSQRAQSIVVPSRTSAFRPLTGAVSTLSPNGGSTIRRPLPGPLPAHIMRPWQSATVASQESESERRQTARMQRAHRRSTQGVTKEQLEEASRLAAEESARRRISQASISTPTGPCRLASEEKDSSAERSLLESTPLSTPRISAEVRLAERRESSERYSDSSRSPSSSLPPSREGSTAPSGSMTNTLTLSAAPPPSATPSAANVRRKSSQILSGMAARSARRGTGPVSPEDIAAAAAAEREERVAAKATTGAAAAASAASSYQARRMMGDTSTTTATVTPFQSSSIGGVGRSSSIGGTTTVRDGLSTCVSRVAPRVATTNNGSGVERSERSNATYAASTISSTAAANVNYRLLYEKERMENEKLRKELEKVPNGTEMNGSNSAALSSTRRIPSRLTSTQSITGGVTKCASGGSMDDAERRTLERRITELELELKSLGQLKLENQRLKEENGALVRVISKMTI